MEKAESEESSVVSDHELPAKQTSSTHEESMHLEKCVTTRHGQDVTLLFAGESTRLLSSILKASPEWNIINRFLPRSILATARRASPHLQRLSELLDEWQFLNRLWGLMGVWVAFTKVARRVVGRSSHKLQLEDVVGIAETVCVAGFHICEAIALLCMKKVIPSSPRTTDNLFLWSSRSWLALVVLDVGRLVEEWIDARRDDEEGKHGKDWMPRTIETLFLVPVALHWSRRRGTLSPIALGALSVCATAGPMRDLWRKTR